MPPAAGPRSDVVDNGGKSSAVDSGEGSAISPSTWERSNEAALPSMETLKLLALGGVLGRNVDGTTTTKTSKRTRRR